MIPSSLLYDISLETKLYLKEDLDRNWVNKLSEEHLLGGIYYLGCGKFKVGMINKPQTFILCYFLYSVGSGGVAFGR